jgi:ribosomal-protein-alanine N-acetyltransferase
VASYYRGVVEGNRLMEELELRPVVAEDLGMFRRFATEPGLVGLDWGGFKDAEASVRRFAEDGFLGQDNGRLIVQTADEAAGFVSWTSGSFDGKTQYWEIGIALLPEFRGRGIGWRAQAIRAAEFRAGQYSDGYLYSRLRDDPRVEA